MLISNGWTDDLFPADEAIRFYNRTRDRVPERRHLAVLRQLRAPARAEQGGRPRGALGAGAGVVQLLREGHRQRAVPRRHDATPRRARTRPRRAAPYAAADWAAARSGRDPARRARAADDPADGGLDRDRGAVRPDHGRRRVRHQLGDRPGRHGDLPHGPGADRRLHADGLAHGGGRHHLAGLRTPRSRRGCWTSTPAPTRRRWSRAACGGRRSRATPGAAGVPAAPERLQVRRRPRGEARAAAEGLEHGGGQQLRPHVEQPAERDGREPAAAAAGARGAGLARRPRPGPGSRRSCRRATQLAPDYPHSRLPAAEGGDAAARVARAGVRGVHGAGPGRTARRSRSRRATRRSRRPTTSPSGRRTPTCAPAKSIGSVRATTTLPGNPATPADEADVRRRGLAHGRRATRATCPTTRASCRRARRCGSPTA